MPAAGANLRTCKQSGRFRLIVNRFFRAIGVNGRSLPDATREDNR